MRGGSRKAINKETSVNKRYTIDCTFGIVLQDIQRDKLPMLQKDFHFLLFNMLNNIQEGLRRVLHILQSKPFMPKMHSL